MSQLKNKKVRLATLDEIKQLRENATATGFPESEVTDRRDSNPFVRHFVIENAETAELLAGCSFKLDQLDGKPAWQLYGVTLHTVRSLLTILFVEIGSEWPLIDDAVKILIAEQGVRMFWSIIQAKITGDYKRQGWEAVGEQLPDAGEKGPYQKIIKFIEE